MHKVHQYMHTSTRFTSVPHLLGAAYEPSAPPSSSSRAISWWTAPTYLPPPTTTKCTNRLSGIPLSTQFLLQHIKHLQSSLLQLFWRTCCSIPSWASWPKVLPIGNSKIPRDAEATSKLIHLVPHLYEETYPGVLHIGHVVSNTQHRRRLSLTAQNDRWRPLTGRRDSGTLCLDLFVLCPSLSDCLPAVKCVYFVCFAICCISSKVFLLCNSYHQVELNTTLWYSPCLINSFLRHKFWD